MTFEEVTLKNVRVTVNFDIDLNTLKRFLETKERDCDDLMAIYDMICTQSDRLNEQGEPENIRAYFDIDPETFNLLEKQVKTDFKKSYVTDSDHPHLRRIKCLSLTISNYLKVSTDKSEKNGLYQLTVMMMTFYLMSLKKP